MTTTTTEPAAAETATPADESGRGSGGPRQLTLSVPTLLTAVALIAFSAVAITFAALYFSSRSDLAAERAQAADNRHAEQLAMDYAVGASTIDYRDTKGWLGKLKSNTTKGLSDKFDATATQLEQILLPLQWTSKATPVQAAVVSENNGIYKVNAFLDVDSTSVQTPQGGRVTVTYTVTLDGNNGWKITDVGGGLDALPAK
ncbi:hypothetical protein [Nocardia inohanensis]|uniref:hypothetical protein n=1 Tax=Nocardia inohanensis TaxID=209246 RepID=UPI0008350129|nr:hypothetical protein [Nocardia inohanensis]